MATGEALLRKGVQEVAGHLPGGADEGEEDPD